jgi:hypothetical protein
MEVSGQLHTLAAFTPGEEPPITHWIGGWVGTRAILDVVVKRIKFQPLPGMEPWSSHP